MTGSYKDLFKITILIENNWIWLSGPDFILLLSAWHFNAFSLVKCILFQQWGQIFSISLHRKWSIERRRRRWRYNINNMCVIIIIIIIKTIRLKHRLRCPLPWLRHIRFCGWRGLSACLAVCLILQSAVLIDELTNQVTTECNGVPLYFKKMYINKRNKHV